MTVWKRFGIPLLQVGFFIAIYYFGGQYLLEKLVEPVVIKLTTRLPLGLTPFLDLDYGRIASRIFNFLWTILLFFSFQKFVHGRAWNDNILFRPKHKLRTFCWGALFGSFLVISLITLAIATQTVVIKAVHLFPGDVFATVSLYIFAMALTATSQELAMRGYILQTLKENWGTHWAVWASALIFGAVHFPYSFYYAYAAFVAGLVLGYAYVWYGIYYCIGWHFMWNFIESVVFSGKIVLFEVNDPFLIGDKNITPDQEGFLVLPILLIGFAILLVIHKTEWRLKS
jgi:membrane protease YdiL (CAAX protease family)